MGHTHQFSKVMKVVVLFGDLVLLNILFLTTYRLFDPVTMGSEFYESLPQLFVLLNLLYLIGNYSDSIVLYRRIVRPERIVRRALRCTFIHTLLFISITILLDIGTVSARFYVFFYSLFFIVLCVYRLMFRFFIKKYRKSGGNSRSVILVGSNRSMVELYHFMVDDPTVGFLIQGYFDEKPFADYPGDLSYLGTPKDVPSYLERHHVEQVYCSLPSACYDELTAIINYCENHLMRFYSVPNVRDYLQRSMSFDVFGNIPVLTIREEPLEQVENRIVKRAFDLLFSGLFLCTLFPFVYLIVGTAIKLSSPGPVLFRQKRSGKQGEEFWCYKFRSMRVNVDSDTLQATAKDPRKTRVGDFIRRTSIDELPQFINVFRGEMSVVGPRPHMLKHTEEYSRLIDTYMVRHFIKPGVTGWAQVNGYRGETKELWQMEGRVQHDVWYLENWTFLLDIYIIYKTVKNAVLCDENAY